MCRHLAWLGAPRTLADIALTGPSSLLVQSYAPRRQSHGTVNADGWGVGFWTDDSEAPARWRSNRPLWTDASFASVAAAVRSGCVLAAVRDATVGMPVDESAAAPFTDGHWLLSHNGVVDRNVLPASRAAESSVDSALLAAHVFARGVDLLAETVCKVGADDPGARLNLLLADGHSILATTWGDTLSYRTDELGTVVASEPTDDGPGWIDVPDRTFLQVSSAGLALTPL